MTIQNDFRDDDFENDIEDGTPAETDIVVEVEDDTPEADRGRQPMPEEIKQELETDELEELSEKARERFKQMKKVWHDERREKERVLREQQAAVDMAKKFYEENKKLRKTLQDGEGELVTSYKTNAEMELNSAKRAYREAYEAGDPDKLAEANAAVSAATYKLEQIKNYRPSLQQEEDALQEPKTPDVPRPDQKAVAWQERNPWYGQEPDMTAFALGFHQKLERVHGAPFVGTDDYWTSIDKEVRKRFPEHFETSVRSKPKPATVVASPKRTGNSGTVTVRLTASEMRLAEKLGVPPKLFAEEKRRLELQNRD